jgi:transcriptional regulator with XRE-family HTH domain
MTDATADADEVTPEQRTGAALREAREARGVSLRELAKQLGYHSHTTLSGYERGSLLPPDQVIAGYERVLRLDSGALMKIVEAARIERHGDVWPKRRTREPQQLVADTAGPTAEEIAEAPPRRQASRRHALIAASAALLIALTATIVVVWSPWSDDGSASPPPSSSAAGPALPQLDGADPKVAGCADDAVTADVIDVFDPPQSLAGKLQLRFSPSCGTSWSRFEPVVGWTSSPPSALEFNVHRPADNAFAPFQADYDGSNQAGYGNMLVSTHECVFAELILHRGDAVSPAFRTGCRRGAG